MLSRKEQKGIVRIVNAAKVAKKMDAWIGCERVLTPDGEGKLHPSMPTPWIRTGSGSGADFLLKKERDDDNDDNDA